MRSPSSYSRYDEPQPVHPVLAGAFHCGGPEACVLRRKPTIEPCLPRPAKEPPCGPDWIHEIKHDGFRILARRDERGVRLFTRNGYDFPERFPLIIKAVAALPVRSCFIDGEAIVVDRNGLSATCCSANMSCLCKRSRFITHLRPAFELFQQAARRLIGFQGAPPDPLSSWHPGP